MSKQDSYSSKMSLYKLRTYSNSRETKSKAIIVRVDPLELSLLKKKAERWCGGNYSDFLRHAILRWEPELTKEEKAHEEALAKVLESA